MYRHFFPPPAAVAATRAAVPALADFLTDYVRGTSFYDWGDDPSFYSASVQQGDPAYAAWGVCRPDVRAALTPGSVVVFFCAKRPEQHSPETHYYFIGVGTVGTIIPDRRVVWTAPRYAAYRAHYNLLARFTPQGHEIQHEYFHPYHPDWQHRLGSPYVLFDPDCSRFNLLNPQWVSTSHGGARDQWLSAIPAVAQLERLLFTDFNLVRRLRTSPTANAHRHLNLTSRLAIQSKSVHGLRDALLPLV